MNFAYCHAFVIVFTLLTYIPGGPLMYGHMAHQRKKKLTPVKKD